MQVQNTYQRSQDAPISSDISDSTDNVGGQVEALTNSFTLSPFFFDIAPSPPKSSREIQERTRTAYNGYWTLRYYLRQLCKLCPYNTTHKYHLKKLVRLLNLGTRKCVHKTRRRLIPICTVQRRSWAATAAPLFPCNGHHTNSQKLRRGRVIFITEIPSNCWRLEVAGAFPVRACVDGK